ncbi:helix-turn-helix domain-containing protein [uncultured Shewanella sp.]|uniref:helix-turn-helix domain-containing protein n=1 Tax=uncultured Shewanella sp. TaxID=173975 RepID=UPI0026222EB0|nr:helix-turn-helix domain-containing protein [uncultured Shewanella sp.]
MQIQLKVPSPNRPWIGDSLAIKSLKSKLSVLSSSMLPVLIHGERGTGKGISARMLHDLSPKQGQPFVSVCCQRWQGQDLVKCMDETWSQADGGTLFLRNVELLSKADVSQIKSYWLSYADNGTLNQEVRLIASTRMPKTLNNAIPEMEDQFMSWLQYHCLTVSLPRLCERADDIETLIKHYQAQEPAIAKLTFSVCAWRLFKHYAWPGNVKQLKRCLDKLAVWDSHQHITEQTLLNLFPAMEWGKSNTADKQKIMPAMKPSHLDEVLAEPYQNVVHFNHHRAQAIKLEDHILTKGVESLHYGMGHHTALDKGLVYLYDNYQKPLMMSELASKAYVSPSHLSFLFKRYLGMTFKQTLLLLRIAEAMSLLKNQPHKQVTQVCNDVGFSDLSFFVRKFKKTVGMSPGVFRDRFHL